MYYVMKDKLWKVFVISVAVGVAAKVFFIVEALQVVKWLVTKTTVVCWVVGIGGFIGFIASLNLPILFGGEYLIVCLMAILGAMYFNIKYKEKAKQKRLTGTDWD